MKMANIKQMKKVAKTNYFKSLSSARRYLASLDCAVYVTSAGMRVYSHDRVVRVRADAPDPACGLTREYWITLRCGKISQEFIGYAS